MEIRDCVSMHDRAGHAEGMGKLMIVFHMKGENVKSILEIW
jgi:hypothetical protein